MKTLVITRFPFSSQYGGEELHTIRLAEKLSQRGWKIILWTSCPILEEEFKKLKNPRIQIEKTKFIAKPPVSKLSLISFSLLSPFLFCYFLIRYQQIRKKHQASSVYMLSLGEKLLLSPSIVIPDLIRNLIHKKSLDSCFRRNDIKICWVEHARIGKWLIANPWKIFYKLWAKWVKIIVVSKQSANLLSWVPNVIDIPNGIDLTEIKAKKTAPKSDLELFMTQGHMIKKEEAGKKFKIGFIGRLTEDKGIKELIEAVAKLDHINLQIVGEGPLRQCHPEVIEGSKVSQKKILHQAQNDGKIQFLGKLSRPEIIDFYRGLDLFVLPSTEHDPFGLVIAESMAAGVPTILTEVCGIADYLEDGVNCKIVPAKNIPALEEAIKWYLDNPEQGEQIIKNGLKTVREKFDLEKMVDCYERLFINQY